MKKRNKILLKGVKMKKRNKILLISIILIVVITFIIILYKNSSINKNKDLKNYFKTNEVYSTIYDEGLVGPRIYFVFLEDNKFYATRVGDVAVDNVNKNAVFAMYGTYKLNLKTSVLTLNMEKQFVASGGYFVDTVPHSSYINFDIIEKKDITYNLNISYNAERKLVEGDSYFVDLGSYEDYKHVFKNIVEDKTYIKSDYITKFEKAYDYGYSIEELGDMALKYFNKSENISNDYTYNYNAYIQYYETTNEKDLKNQLVKEDLAEIKDEHENIIIIEINHEYNGESISDMTYYINKITASGIDEYNKSVNFIN